MAQAPIMPLFVDALISDTMHLSPEQFGAYVRILLATWRNNGKALPDDDAKMARICIVGIRKWRAHLRREVAPFFEIKEGAWHQQRLEKEWERVKRALEQKRAVAKAGGQARAQAHAKPTITIYREESSSSLPVAARACVPALGAAHAHDTDRDNGWKPVGEILGHPPAAPLPTEENWHAERQQRHLEWLKDRGAPGELRLYLAAQMSDDPDTARRMFELVETRMNPAEVAA